MLFNSYIFILIFLPVVLMGFFLIGARGHQRIAVSWLVASSLFFYGWWNPAYLGLILASIFFNYALGVSLNENPSRRLLAVGIVINLAALGLFKYANFFVDNLNLLIHADIDFGHIILPLAISFFTFQQIAYLADAHRGVTRESSFLHYCLFVSFFPQLIAGPIVHHKEMLPQFAKDLVYKFNPSNLAIGLTIFILGLFKKVVLADNIALHATPVFEAAGNGVAVTFFEAWGGALAYTFQLYFDFSGYSDMAIGLARMFGIVLPLNFYSPYKANNIIEFWKRWHITLSRFLKDYLYIPLGGNRKGSARRYVNLMITMLLGGLWHGAGWTFLAWGAMHGLYLCVNHFWRWLWKCYGKDASYASYTTKLVSRLFTFFSVVVAWVMFRAESFDGAVSMYKGMFAFNGIALPTWSESYLVNISEIFSSPEFVYKGMFYNGVFGDVFTAVSMLIAMFAIVWLAPNTLELVKSFNPALEFEKYKQVENKYLVWRFNSWTALLLAILSATALFFMSAPTEFLYFQF